ncbi:hypothetical protein ES702_00837 [subsurface metagenome]
MKCGLRGEKMQSKSILSYIDFGTELRYTIDVKAGWRVHGEGAILENIDRFFAHLQEFDLPVTQRAAYKLRQFRDKLAKSDSDHKLTDDEASKLTDIMYDVRNTLSAEADGNVAFIVTDKRIDVNKLLSDVPALMAPSVFNSLPEIAQYDFIEAGKCIAFELPTSAAFHMLRGTEAVLRHYYCSIVRRNRAELLWGPMVESLRRRRIPPPAPLLDNLDNIRRSFRNPTQHPDKIYDIQEVQDLFGLCVDVINRMVALL